MDIGSLIFGLLGAGASAYGSKQMADSSKFQGKPIPLTPQEQWLFDQQKSNYNSSPTRDAVGSITTQFLKNMYGNNVQGAGGFVPKFSTDRFQSMGLPSGPKIDFSGIADKWWNPATAGAPAGPAGGGRTAPPPPLGQPKGPGGQQLPTLTKSPNEDRFGGNREIVDYDVHAGNPAYSGPSTPSAPPPGLPENWQPDGSHLPNESGNIMQRAWQFLQENPSAKSLGAMGLAAVTGIPTQIWGLILGKAGIGQGSIPTQGTLPQGPGVRP